MPVADRTEEYKAENIPSLLEV